MPSTSANTPNASSHSRPPGVFTWCLCASRSRGDVNQITWGSSFLCQTILSKYCYSIHHDVSYFSSNIFNSEMLKFILWIKICILTIYFTLLHVYMLWIIVIHTCIVNYDSYCVWELFFVCNAPLVLLYYILRYNVTSPYLIHYNTLCQF